MLAYYLSRSAVAGLRLLILCRQRRGNPTITGKELDGGSVRLNQIMDAITQHRVDRDVAIQNDDRAAHLVLALGARALRLRAFLKSAAMASTSTPCADNSLSSHRLGFFRATKSASA